MPFVAGVDVGGTFTDVTIVDTESGRSWSAKVPSTPADQSQGFVDALAKAAARAGIDLTAIERCFHGTTVATNAILQRSETHLGLITTAGFKYVLEIGRHDIPRAGSYYGWQKPAGPVSPELIREVDERVDVHGRILRPLDEDGARLAVRSLRDRGVESIAVSLLYAFLNPAHEQRLRAIIAAEHPAALVSLSSEVLPRFREFERTMTTVLNAYVAPHVGRYLAALERRLRERGSRATLLIVKSNGGVVGAETAAVQAIHTAVSGPAAGVIGAAALGLEAGFPNIISIDVGGTSADVCLVRDGRPEVTNAGRVGGFPMEVPMLDVHTIGAGGGSIAALTGTGGITVGPRSAGAEPGPACYGRGGTEPTVTDANLVLGRLPGSLLGGEVTLDVQAAHAAIARVIAQPLGLDVVHAAEGIIAIVNNAMVGAIRAVSVARGLDPRDYALVAFGGAGPLHGTALAAQLGIDTVIVPPRPGVLTTEGLLRTDLRNDYVRTCTQSGPDFDVAALNTVLDGLVAQAGTDLDREGVPIEQRELRPAADLRYQHQGYELSVPIPDGRLTDGALREVVEAFHREHQRLYSYELRGQAVELVNLRIAATGRLPHAAAAPPSTAVAEQDPPAPAGQRQAYLGGESGWVETPVYLRTQLTPGMRLVGPLLIDQEDSTTLLLAGHTATVDRLGNLVVRLDGAGAAVRAPR